MVVRCGFPNAKTRAAPRPFGPAADGKMSEKGMPNPLRLAVIAKHHFDDVRLTVIPHVLQRAALAAGAPLGGALGDRAV